MSVTGCSLMRKDQSEMLASTKQEGGAGGEGEGGDGEDGARSGGLCCQNKELMLNEVENNHVCWGGLLFTSPCKHDDPHSYVSSHQDVRIRDCEIVRDPPVRLSNQPLSHFS